MTAFFDTSVLLAAFFEDHEHHEPSFRAFTGVNMKTGSCASHSLAELYATTTRLPGRHRLSADQALLLLENVRERLGLVSLDPPEYLDAIRHAASIGVVGGTVYDALLVACAVKKNAKVIYTWNVDHFRYAWPDVADRIHAPS